MNNIRINDEKIQVKEYKGFKVVTFDDIDRVHKRPKGTAKRNFNTNKKHFLLSEDYFEVKNNDLRELKQSTNFVLSNAKTLILLTQTGYLMLVKSFTDNLSWNVQRVLVNNYFNEKQPQQTQIQLPKPYELIKKYYNDEPVMTVLDLAYIFKIDRYSLHSYIKKFNIKGVLLQGEELKQFKNENPCILNMITAMYVFNRNEAIKLSTKLKMTNKQKELIEYYGEPITKETYQIDKETMYIGLTQIELLLKLAKEVKDPYRKNYLLESATKLLINLGLWDKTCKGYSGTSSDWDINSLEGWNKISSVHTANRLMREDKLIDLDILKNINLLVLKEVS